MSHFPLIVQLQHMSAVAQRTIIEMYAKEMFAVCKRYVNFDMVANQVMMKGFERFFRSVVDFEYRGDNSVRAYIKKIMVNECLMHMRKEKVRFVAGSVEIHENMLTEDLVTPWVSEKDLYRLIFMLPDSYRTVFCMHVVDGYTHDEIAAALGITSQVSAQTLRRARALLKRLILKYYDNDGRRKNE